MRGNDSQVKVHYQGKNEDFIVFVESGDAVENWKKDSSIPLAQVVDGYKVFVTHKHGSQGVLDTASKGTLEGEFDTSNEDAVIKTILEKGKIMETENSSRNGVRNVTQGGTVGH